MGQESRSESTAESAIDPDPRRLCARVGCAGEAVATLTADYEGRQMAVGPLSPEPQPPAHDLCARHLEALSAPEGWELIRHEQAHGDTTGESHDDAQEDQRG